MEFVMAVLALIGALLVLGGIGSVVVSWSDRNLKRRLDRMEEIQERRGTVERPPTARPSGWPGTSGTDRLIQ